MLKLLLILVIAAYVLSKVGRFIFGFGMRSSQNRQFYKPKGGNVNVNDISPQSKNKSTIKGGEYIDFEEVK